MGKRSVHRSVGRCSLFSIKRLPIHYFPGWQSLAAGQMNRERERERRLNSKQWPKLRTPNWDSDDHPAPSTMNEHMSIPTHSTRASEWVSEWGLSSRPPLMSFRSLGTHTDTHLAPLSLSRIPHSITWHTDDGHHLLVFSPPFNRPHRRRRLRPRLSLDEITFGCSPCRWL